MLLAMRNDPYTHFSQQADVAGNILLFFTKRKKKKTKK